MSHLMILLIFVTLYGSAIGAPTLSEEDFVNHNCEAILDRGEEKQDFFKSVVHGIHSITLEDLWFYFDEDIPELNNIPNVNTNLSSPDFYTQHAPRSLPKEKDVQDKYIAGSEYLRAMDFIMRNEAPDFMVKGPSLLEKLAHQFHMKEMWAMAAAEYERLKSDPPSSAFCSCALDYPSKMIDHLVRLAVKYRCFDKTNGVLPDKGVTVEEACAVQKDAPEFKDDQVATLGHLYKVGSLKDDANLHKNWHDYKFMHMSSMIPHEAVKDTAHWLFCRIGRDLKGMY